MNVYAYAGFSYLFTAAISLFMIGVVVASFIYAVSVSMFLDPNSLAPGGITGNNNSNGEGME